MESDRLRGVLESLLFAADGPVSAERLRDAVGEVPRKEIIDALEALRHEYEHTGRGLRVAEVANGYQLRTAREHAEFVRRLTAVKPARMSRANLETLAIIAYRQPVTRAEIEEIRGVNVDGVVSTLLERRMIRIVARKDVAGKPFLYGTTREFLEAFNLKDLAGLPTLEEMEDMTQALRGAEAAELFPEEGVTEDDLSDARPVNIAETAGESPGDAGAESAGFPDPEEPTRG
ncbi:MAG: SMC-Scp complex subunit ScpB [Deltaproteobacteria bacterium]|nr:SMC-Scp complex subunit ScpB [Deltaproteobacteria bacterium]